VKNLQITEKYTIRGTRSMDSYLREVDKTKPMTANKEYEVAVLAQAGDEKAQAILVSSNLRFVISVAKRYSRDPDTVLLMPRRSLIPTRDSSSSLLLCGILGKRCLIF